MSLGYVRIVEMLAHHTIHHIYLTKDLGGENVLDTTFIFAIPVTIPVTIVVNASVLVSASVIVSVSVITSVFKR